MRDPFEDLFPPSEGEDVKKWYREFVAGTYVSNWEFLRASAASSFLQAASAVSGILKAWQNGILARQHPAETGALLFMNYRVFASGPLLAATLTPLFAIEAFARHAAEIGVRRRVLDANALELALGNVDSLPILDRIKVAARLADAAPVPLRLVQDIEALVQFRNDTAHDAPLLRDEFGNLLHVKRGRVKVLDEANELRDRYPRLALESMPLRLRHAKAAADAHDEFMEHIRTTSNADYWNEFMQSFGANRTTLLQIKDLGGRVWTDWTGLEDAWDELLEWEESVPMTERESWLRDLLRKKVIKVEDDSEAEGSDEEM